MKTCNICEATFKMERGCHLEKRCPACRFLDLVKIPENPFTRGCSPGTGRFKLVRAIKGLTYCWYSEEMVLKEYDGLEGEYFRYTEEEMINPEENAIKEDYFETILNVLHSILKPNEAWVIGARFGLNEERSEYTLAEIGQKLGVGRERARQIEGSAIKKLKHRAARGSLKYQLALKDHPSRRIEQKAPHNANYNPKRGGKQYDRFIPMSEEVPHTGNSVFLLFGTYRW